ncbi:hypothetical protein Ana3638_20885 [Anaerocolumna sedimenticola]|uniref:FtsK domain-containing protein n=1 Tax=Anaerocolumna sedimenticola TaxID=2696063 RepID=A0A6P1TRQ9_9FIRM|nr:hypothetical protein [Anaerocolumna sedimenticola]QHQ62932.1 hypothetical protein Ana3638_20885 [Anaerocolumna sedimenticola]
MNIDTFINESLLQNGLTRYIPWKILEEPHALIVGSSGSGKSFSSLLLLARLSLHLKNLVLTVCDFKGDKSFAFLNGQPGFYRYSECLTGINAYYDAFIQRQSGNDTSDNFHILFIDEYSSFLLSLLKAEAEAVKSKLSQILFMGRSFHFFLIISMQRCDSTFFPSGARENFSMTYCTGSISPELRDMIFFNFKEAVKVPKQRGHGYMLKNGTELYQFVVPQITSLQKVQACIKKTTEISEERRTE